MPSEKQIPARAVAVDVLNQFDPKRDYASVLLNKLLHKTNEKQRATDIVFGTIRNRTAIDMVITRFADCPTDRIPAKLLNIIRIGVYEFIYSPQTAEYAIVNEAVENAKTVGGKKQAGFVNAVLRQIARHIKNRQIQLSQADVRSVLPQTPSNGCQFDDCFLPEPGSSPADYLASVFSLPKWLVTDWLVEFGFEKTREICFASNRKASIYIRPNRLRTTTQKLAEKFRQAGVDFEILPDESMIKIKSPRAVTELPGFEEGLFSIQDISASQAVKALAPQPAQTILDLCAAPGVKTAQLAELTDDKAKIIATDIDSERLEKVKENISRLRLNSVSVVAYEELKQKAAEVGPFDAVLLDVLCSNTGVLTKRIEVRFRLKPETRQEMAKIQLQLLEKAATMVKTQGKICYSTCSIEACENGQLVRGFLKNHNFKLESEALILPRPAPATGVGDHDGGYVAIITGK